MRLCYICILFVLLALISQRSLAETLQDLLASQHVPQGSFSREELAMSIQGTGKDNGTRVVVVYSLLKGDAFVGPIQVLEYNYAERATRRAVLPLDQSDICLGSPEDIYFIDGYTLFSVSLSPSAECLVLLDNKLAVSQRFYGFFPVRVAPGLIAITENMVHFAPVHPERLQLIDLSTGKTIEVYPPANDPLRARLARDHAKHMPTSDVCMLMNDPCDPKLFDEEFSSIATGADGRFAFVATQSASHALAEDTEPKTVAQQFVFYSYALEKSAWRYCEELVPGDQAEKLQNTLKDHFKDEVAHHCKPDQLVFPDMATSEYNPFRQPH
jgi:hypothetical protein